MGAKPWLLDQLGDQIRLKHYLILVEWVYCVLGKEFTRCVTIANSSDGRRRGGSCSGDGVCGGWVWCGWG